MQCLALQTQKIRHLQTGKKSLSKNYFFWCSETFFGDRKLNSSLQQTIYWETCVRNPVIYLIKYIFCSLNLLDGGSSRSYIFFLSIIINFPISPHFLGVKHAVATISIVSLLFPPPPLQNKLFMLQNAKEGSGPYRPQKEERSGQKESVWFYWTSFPQLQLHSLDK